jgi:hypothetical protein
MAKYHIGKDGEPHLCNAEKRPCPLKQADGSPVPHYGSMEQAYEALYVKESHSLNDAIRYQKKYENWADKDQDVQDIIDDAFAGKRFQMFKTANAEYSVPVKTVRQSKATRELTAGMHDRFKSVRSAQEAMTPDGKLAAQYASMTAIESDMKRLKASTAQESLANVLYVNSRADGAFQVQVSASIDKNKIKSDLDMSDADLEKFYDVSTGDYSVSSVKKAFNDSIADAIPAGTRGAPAKRKAAWDASGLAVDEVTYSPDKKALEAVASAHNDAVISEQFDDDKLGTMWGSAKRAALCELGVQHQILKDEISAREDALRKQGASESGDPNAVFKKLSESDSDGLKFKERHSAVLNEKNVDAFARQHGIDAKTLRKTSKSFTLDKFKEFAKDKKIPTFKYLKPQRAVHLRYMKNQKAYDDHTVAARDVVNA